VIGFSIVYVFHFSIDKRFFKNCTTLELKKKKKQI
jgi:hypothetical protein